MLKARAHLTHAMLSIALLLSVVATAHAQSSSDAGETPVVAETSQTNRTHQADGEPLKDATKDAPVQVAQTSGQTSGGGQATATPTPTPTPTPTTPLTAGEKISRSFRSAFLSPFPYVTSAFSAGLTQFGEDRQPHKDGGDEVADWGSRAARNFATRSTSAVFSNGFYPALFKQDPRYEASRRKGFGRRALHAVSRLFVTRDDDGNLEPNYSRFAGVMTASALSNVWERSTPGHDRIGMDATLRRFGRSFINGSFNNIVFREFWPDIIGIFRR
ncbi:MAG TPA: hypothetical protein VEX60_03915 [Pyrinomonadaceae bacterium]|nr:hypothetical protein [Pyrinomonadaceae bacterium]